MSKIIEEVLQEVREAEAARIAISMLDDGLPPERIAKLTGIPLTTVQELAQKRKDISSPD
jgi:hypothetical protein